MTFTHSNASYIQLLKNKNAESIVSAIRHIRMNTKPGTRYINWSPYIRLLADKQAAIYDLTFLNLFEENNEII